MPIRSDYSDLPPSFDVPGVAAVLKCHDHTVRRLIRSGELEHVRLGRLIRVPRHALVAYLSSTR